MLLRSEVNSLNECESHSESYINATEEEWNKHMGYHFWDEEVPERGHYETKVIKEAYDEKVWVQN